MMRRSSGTKTVPKSRVRSNSLNELYLSPSKKSVKSLSSSVSTSSLYKSYYTNVSKASRSGLVFNINKVHKNLKRLKMAKNIRIGAPIYCAAVLEYLCSEILEISGSFVKESGRKRITPRYIKLSICQDHELSSLLKRVIIPDGGVMPFIHSVLLPKKTVI